MVQNAVYIETKQGSQNSELFPGNIVNELDVNTARPGLKTPVGETKDGKMCGKAQPDKLTAPAGSAYRSTHR